MQRRLSPKTDDATPPPSRQPFVAPSLNSISSLALFSSYRSLDPLAFLSLSILRKNVDNAKACR